MFQDPLSLVPYAIAAGGGHLQDVEAARLVTAGLTLLQRSAPLVRALGSRSAALLLPDSAATLVALAACEGRCAHLLPTDIGADTAEALRQEHGIGAVFTVQTLAPRVPPSLPVVLLDEAPWRAVVRTPERVQQVDLGSHHGLDLIGDTATQGREEPFVVIEGVGLTHADVLREARDAVERLGLTPMHVSRTLRPFHTRDGLVLSLVAPLLAGGRVAI